MTNTTTTVENRTAFLGLDTHKETIAIAIAEDGRAGEVRYFGQIRNEPSPVIKLVKRLAEKYDKLFFCYEAGPCGYGLQRLIAGLGHDCVVISPSHTPKKGVHIKNDRRDALELARLHRSGDLTPIWVPDTAHEAIRDLVRARITAMEMTKKYRQHLQGFLLRHGRIFQGRSSWTKAHLKWIRGLEFEHPAHYILIEENLAAIRDSEARLGRLEQLIMNIVPSWTLAPLMEAFQAMRGISHIAAVILVSEIGDFQRFAHPRQLASYVELSPSEHSSGEKTIRGSITKAGTERGRRVLIEGAWTYRMPARIGNHIAKRHNNLPQEVLDIAWKAQVRLCKRYRSMTARGKNKNVAITAIAREMVCFLWAIARTVKLPSPVVALVS
jgi:transposase